MESGHVALRKGRRSIAGQTYLVTFTTARRQQHFASWAVATDASRMLSDAASWQGSRLLAWVLMPDHLHGLIELGDGATLSTCVGRCKGMSARRLRNKYPQLGQIWAPGFHDRALRWEEDAVTAARYLVMNPVRAGRVETVGAYPFWDAVWI